MAGRIRAHDWASTPLGSIEGWPQSLKSVVDLMLCARQPASIAFGPALTSLYNDAYISILGTAHPKSLGQPYREAWPEPWPKLRPIIEVTLAGEGQHITDHPIFSAGCTGRPTSWFTCSWTPLRDETGTVKGFYCSATETTAQVLAQRTLRDSEERLRFSLRGAGAAAWQWDFLTREMVWSPESYELHGRNPQSGPPGYDDWLRCLHPEDRPRVEKVVFDAIEKRSPEYRTEYRVVFPSGEVRWLDALGKVDYAADGSPLRMSGVNLDITARKRAEELRKQEHHELETILAAIPAAVMITKDASCAEMIGNPAACDLLERPAGTNLSKSAPAGQTPDNFEIFQNGCRLSPADLPIRKASAWKCAVSGEELELRFVDGRSKFLLGNALPLFDDAGEVRGAVAAFADITDLKRTEAALRESEERLKFALDAAGAGTWEVALEAERLSISDRALALKGLPPGTPITHEKALAAIHPEDKPRFEEAFRHTREMGEPFRVEFRVPLPDGSIRWLESRGEPRFVRGTQVIAGLVLDVTDRKRAEEALRESEEFLRAIIEHAPVPILLSREDRKILLINPALTKLTGYTASDIPTRNEWEAWAYRENAPSAEVVREVFEQGTPTDRGALWVYTKSGEKRLWAIKTAPAGCDASGKRLMVTVGLDITERKKSEDALASALRLEAVGKLAGGVAHDFNNLLAVITGNLELAQDRIRDETIRDLIRRALNAGEKGSDLNRRLLSLARKRTLKPQHLNLNTRVEDIAKLLQTTLGEHIEVATELSADLWMTLADPGEIDSAILNVGANARDAMPNGGRLRISTGNIAIDASAAARFHPDAGPGDYVQLVIADNGVGMSKDVLRKAIEPFFTTKEPGAGTGLGLASVASFARQTGGFAAVESASGCGCAVSLYLPRSLEAPPAPKIIEDRDRLPLGDGELVLVVEDNDQVREVMLKRIESLGYSVTEARTGVEAVQRLKSEEPVQIVLSDIVMPGDMTGHDVARWVTSNKPEIQVILCSGYNAEDPRGDSQSSVRDRVVLGKPYSRAQLAHALSDALLPAKTN